jgi:predicted chitinase
VAPGAITFLPVKVKSISADEARVTEQDGDQFTVNAKGTYKAINKGAKQGASPTQKATKTYTDDDGSEFAYFGRGYVQLTWWSNYAKAGTELGLGLQLLLNPDTVLQPATAYKVMAHGMLTGKGFANGKKLSTYFHGAKTDYVGARHMVNGHDHAADIARIAKHFETILLAAKP